MCLLNVGDDDDVDRLNVGDDDDVDRLNVGDDDDVDRLNVGDDDDVDRLNVGDDDDVDRLNVGDDDDVDRLNVGADDDVDRLNVGDDDDVDRLNVGDDDDDVDRLKGCPQMSGWHIRDNRSRRPMMMKCCLVSSDVSWHIRDKLWPMPKHGSVILYVHGNQKGDQLSEVPYIDWERSHHTLTVLTVTEYICNMRGSLAATTDVTWQLSALLEQLTGPGSFTYYCAVNTGVERILK